MIVAVPSEAHPAEQRVALVPVVLAALAKAGMKVRLQRGAGAKAGYVDSMYQDAGAEFADTRDEVYAGADVVVNVQGPGVFQGAGRDDLGRLKAGQVLIGLFNPLGLAQNLVDVARTGATVFALELLPRISRAQPMDVLTSMASVAGYKAVLMAADALPKMFPLMMTAAGTITPARVLVIGAGVAGLQAISTARRLGAVVHAYDVRPAVKEQIESLGAKFVELPLETKAAEGTGGYAKAMDEAFYQKQRELLGKVVAESDVVITTAAVPGKKAPVLVTETMVQGMRPGSVIVDLAAETGGNCELTKMGGIVEKYQVSIQGPVNLASTIPFHASQMYARNVASFLGLLAKDGKLVLNREDEIIRETLVCFEGDVVHPRVKELLAS